MMFPIVILLFNRFDFNNFAFGANIEVIVFITAKCVIRYLENLKPLVFDDEVKSSFKRLVSCLCKSSIISGLQKA